MRNATFRDLAPLCTLCFNSRKHSVGPLKTHFDHNLSRIDSTITEQTPDFSCLQKSDRSSYRYDTRWRPRNVTRNRCIATPCPIFASQRDGSGPVRGGEPIHYRARSKPLSVGARQDRASRRGFIFEGWEEYVRLFRLPSPNI